MSPLRWFPSLATIGPHDGIHPYVSFMKYLARVVLPAKWIFKVDIPGNNEFADAIGTDLVPQENSFKAVISSKF
jgi:hypothetical protein